MTSPDRRVLLPLFLVSLAAVGYETALTRYFAVAKWSEYGYWVISIVMAGFALSGVFLALTRDALARRGEALLAWLPPLLVVSAAVGYHFVTVNPFNPLQLQNPATIAPQLWNIAGYYAALLPFFFAAGLFVSLCFVLRDRAIGRVYAFDLTGAGAGALLVLLLMYVLHPFDLVAAMLVPLALAGTVSAGRRRAALGASLLALLAGEALLLGAPAATMSEFKAVYAPLHTPDARVLAELRSPRGDDLLLDDFTERVDTDISNNAGLLGLPGPPRTYGLYRDGNRIAALPRAAIDTAYAGSTLDALPYALIPHARALVAGASGGFRAALPLALGAASADVLEPDPVLRDAVTGGLAGAPPLPPDPRRHVRAEGALGAATAGHYDIVDVSADFADAAPANVTALTVEAIAADLRAVAPDGIVSLPAPIRDFSVYALRMIAAARDALRATGVTDAGAHVVVYRSAWNARVLVSPAPFDAARVAAIRAWCDARSFDVSYAPGPPPAQAEVYNDLPPVSFATGETLPGSDAIGDEAAAVLGGDPTRSGDEFSLDPPTLERPFVYAALRLSHLRTILQRLEILPQAEIGALVNLAVLAQALALAMVVVALPLLAPRRLRGAAGGPSIWRAAAYFPALGLGFLFIEIAGIERASLYLDDRTGAFAIVLTAMLVFSGLGAFASSRMARDPRACARAASAVVFAWCVAAAFAATPLIVAGLSWPWPLRAALVVAALAPVSVALGTLFPLGLSQAGQGALLPWAWGLNGAFSVVATPAANLLARDAGVRAVLLAAAMLYVVPAVAFPIARRSRTWSHSPSAAGD